MIGSYPVGLKYQPIQKANLFSMPTSSSSLSQIPIIDFIHNGSVMFTPEYPSQTTEPGTQLLTGQVKSHLHSHTILAPDLALIGSSSSQTLTSPQEPDEATVWAPSRSQAVQMAHLGF